MLQTEGDFHDSHSNTHKLHGCNRDAGVKWVWGERASIEGVPRRWDRAPSFFLFCRVYEFLLCNLVHYP